MILADENIDDRIIHAIRAQGTEVLSVKESHRGMSDEEVIVLSQHPPRIILTEDKDFGEWVYAHQQTNISVILLRYSYQDTSLILKILLQLLTPRERWKNRSFKSFPSPGTATRLNIRPCILNIPLKIRNSA